MRNKLVKNLLCFMLIIASTMCFVGCSNQGDLSTTNEETTQYAAYVEQTYTFNNINVQWNEDITQDEKDRIIAKIGFKTEQEMYDAILQYENILEGIQDYSIYISPKKVFITKANEAVSVNLWYRIENGVFLLSEVENGDVFEELKYLEITYVNNNFSIKILANKLLENDEYNINNIEDPQTKEMYEGIIDFIENTTIFIEIKLQQ